MEREPITTQSRKRGFNNERKEKEEGQHSYRIQTNHIVLLSLSLSNFLSLFLFLPSCPISIERLPCRKFQYWRFSNEIRWTRNAARHPIN